MPNFNDDVVIEEHNLVLHDAGPNEIARLDQDGNLVVRREAAGVLVELLQFLGAAGVLSVGAPELAGSVRVMNADGEAILLRGDDATIVLGTDGEAGDLVVNGSTGQPTITAFGSDASVSVGTAGNGGELSLHDGVGREVVRAQSSSATVFVGAEGNEGDVIVHDGNGRQVIHADGSSAWLRVGVNGNEGDIEVQDESGRRVFHLNGSNAVLYVGAEGNEGDVEVHDQVGRRVFHMNGEYAAFYVGAEGNEGDIIVRDGRGRDVFHMNGDYAALYVGASGNEGDIIVRDSGGREVFHVNGEHAVVYVGADGNEGDIIVRDGEGADRIHLNGNDGDIRLMGADLAEDFRADVGIEPGSVVVAVGPDEVAPSTAALDRRVIGVASGAGDHQPALRLATRPGEDRVPVALVGRVYCKADAGPGAITAGDLLTTSDSEGCAMRAGDPSAAGAIFAKALAPLEHGTGTIPVLLTLQ